MAKTDTAKTNDTPTQSVRALEVTREGNIETTRMPDGTVLVNALSTTQTDESGS